MNERATEPTERTKDPVNQSLVEMRERIGFARLGLMTNQVWHDDPRRLGFTLARYKFVAKMLSGCTSALEVGAGDGFCARVVAQEVGKLTISDYDPLFMADARARMTPPWIFDTLVHDMLAGPVPGVFDAIYSLDVLEHVPEEKENVFLGNLTSALSPYGVAIIGMPSLESQSHASPASREGHINCKTGRDLQTVMKRHFHNVFIFSMNDEVVHTGFFPMAHYLLALGCSKR